jgi:oxygen-independent coproporphyrinogen-3 oxidase
LRYPEYVTNAGIYIHIPFCRTKCTYCAFNSGDYDPAVGTDYVTAVCEEIRRSDKSIAGHNVDSIFFGGGTPSILPADQLISILETCRSSFQIASDTEITVEINPGTITPEKVATYMQAGINRASLGVQSFIDRELQFIGRIHSAQEARDSVSMLKQGSFKNISIDLIAGLPYQVIDDWRFNIAEALKLGTHHISVYMLEVHEGTTLFHQVKRGEVARPDEDLSVTMYYELIEALEHRGYEQYEISNFAVDRRYRSRHNIKYWTDIPYYGFGCGAHAFDGNSRWWNIKPLRQYIDSINRNGHAIAEKISINSQERAQEAAFLGLRLMDGINLSLFRQRYGLDIIDRFGSELDRLFAAGLIKRENDTLGLTKAGLALSNEVFSVFV